MDHDTLKTLQSILTDDAKSQRLAEIMAATDAMNAAMADLEVMRDGAAAQLREALDKLEEARGLRDAAAQRHNELDTRELEMGKVSDALNAEKKAFEEVRNAVEKDLRDRGARLTATEDAVLKREQSALEREAAVAARESDVGEAATSLDAKHAALHSALAVAFPVEPHEPMDPAAS